MNLAVWALHRSSSLPRLGGRLVSLLLACGTAAALRAGEPAAGALDTPSNVHYVVWSGLTPVAPYTNWVTAATNIQDAIDVATSGDTVLVSNGFYAVSRAVTVTNDVTVKSVVNAAATVINGLGLTRCMVVTHPGAVVEGFALLYGKTVSFSEYGAGLVLSNGLVDRCIIAYNTAADTGAGVAMYGGTLRNTLVYSNDTHYCAGVYMVGGSVLDCTIVGNSATASGIGGVGNFSGTGVVCNTIIQDNVGGLLGTNYGGSLSFSYCCVAPLPSGEGNFAADALFEDPPSGDYRPSAASPCRNAGTNQPWMAAARDLGGFSRILAGRVDVGAYETLPPAAGSRYVRLNSPTPSPPYTNWATAATSIQDAVNAAVAGDTVWVSNGAYAVGATMTPGGGLSNRVLIDKAVTVVAVNGPLVTSIVGAGPMGDSAVRCVFMTNGATLSGFTLTNGYTRTVNDTAYDQSAAGALLYNGGTLTNCVVSGCRAEGQGGGAFVINAGEIVDSSIVGNQAVRVDWSTSPAVGGGVFLQYGGLLRRSIVKGNLATNTASTATPLGGGVFLSYGGTVDACVISDNTCAGYDGAWGGGAYLVNGGEVRNSLLRGNVARQAIGSSRGGGLYFRFNGVARNCTVVDNASTFGGGIYRDTAGTIYNSIVYFNRGITGTNHYGASGGYSYTCITPSQGGEGGLVADPLFVNAAAGDYRLAAGSPCVNAGTNAYAVGTADLDGLPRVQNGTVDMGAYERAAATAPAVDNGSGATGLTTGSARLTARLVTDGGAATTVRVYWGPADGGLSEGVWSNRIDFGVVPTGALATNVAGLTAGADYYYRAWASNMAGVAWAPASVPFRALSDGSSNIHFVSVASATPVAPYLSWDTAATSIQDAVDAATAGDTVMVSNGVYAAGTRVTPGYSLSNRVAITKPILVQSVNGPSVTAIQGQGPKGAGAVRCVFISDGALSGFSLTNGATFGSGYVQDLYGGGVFAQGGMLSNCRLAGNTAEYGGGAALATLSNCVLSGNSASFGGGSYQGRLANCSLLGNTAAYSGGGAQEAMLENCVVADNSSRQGGGANECSLAGCTVTMNSAADGGGVVGGGAVNSIVYGNQAPVGREYSGGSFTWCCTSPDPGGAGNITNAPRFASLGHIAVGSPCMGAGSDTNTVGVDIDGEAWKTPPSIGCDEPVVAALTGALSLRLMPAVTTVCPGASVGIKGSVVGRCASNVWTFADGSEAANAIAVDHVWSMPGDYVVEFRAFNLSNPAGVATTVTIHVVSAASSARYVWTNSPVPAFPYDHWTNAAHTLQEAVDAAVVGGWVWVTNGVYDAGVVTNYPAGSGEGTRLVLRKAVAVKSVNGPDRTIVDGRDTVRCVYMIEGASLEGFTLTNGIAASGGGVYAEGDGATVSNCVIQGNLAQTFMGECRGGGAYQGSLFDCTLSGNTVSGMYGKYGGGACRCQLDRCTLTGNSAGSGSGGGAEGSTLKNCLVSSNAAYRGGGVYGGTVVNGLITGNSATYGGGSEGGVLVNCTVAGNQADWGGGIHGDALYPAALTNCIVSGNSATNGPEWDGAPEFAYSCTAPDPGGVSNLLNSPLFADPANGDFRLQDASRCIDAGLTMGWMAGMKDRDGNPRVRGSAVDMGAYEHSALAAPVVDNGGGATELAVTSARLNGRLLAGIGTTAVVRVYWGLNDGGISESAWSNRIDVGSVPLGGFSTILAGLVGGTTYSYRVWASNSAGIAWAPASAVFTTLSDGAGNTHYVSAGNPAPLAPYLSWATAATSLQEAVDAATAGDTVLVSNGWYATGGRAVFGTMTNRVAVDKPITVRSVGGPATAFIVGAGVGPSGTDDGDGAVRCAYLTNGAVLAGFTLTNGHTRTYPGDYDREQSGGGVWCESTNSAVVTNCVITDSVADYVGGGAYGGLLLNSRLSGNVAYSYGGGAANGMLRGCVLAWNWADLRGGGAYESTLVGSRVVSNTANYGGGTYGGALYGGEVSGNTASLLGGYGGSGGGAYDGTFFNCLFVGNAAAVDGGGVFGSALDNCTVAGNSAATGGGVGGGVGHVATVLNSVVFSNLAASSPNWSGGSFAYSCTSPDPGGTGNLVGDPLFVDPANGDYHLQEMSPCIGAGTNMSWMAGATDLDGRPRILGGRVDMGAYEILLTPGGVTSVIPGQGPLAGGNTVRITGSNLGNGADITNVTLCGVSVGAVISQSPTQVVVTAGGGLVAGPGDVAVCSMTRGITVAVNGYTYNAAGRIFGDRYVWTERQPAGPVARMWRSVASSADGSRLIAGVYGGGLYTSPDYGQTWVARLPGGVGTRSWFTVSSSGSGQRLVAGVFGGRIFTSADFGNTWSESQPAGAVDAYWHASASSADGLTLAIGVANTGGGRFYTSANGGVSWMERQPAGNTNRTWGAVAMSANGQSLLAGVDGQRLYGSANGGGTWVERRPAGALDRSWRLSAMSADGMRQFAGVAYGGRLYRSADGGAVWTECQPAGNTNLDWRAVTCSGDGSRVLAAVFGGRLYLSVDGGNAWREEQPAGNVNGGWWTCASSVDGYQLVAADGFNRLYTGVAVGGVTPASGPVAGGNVVVISGSGLGDGSDVTNVTLCGTPVSAILRQSATQVVVSAGAAGAPGVGDVVVASISRGVIVAGGAYAYALPGPQNVVASDGAYTNKVSVSWDPVAGASGYALWRGTTTNLAGAAQVALLPATNRYDDVTALPATPYFYWVQTQVGTNGQWFSMANEGYVAQGVSFLFYAGVGTSGVYSIYRCWENGTREIRLFPESADRLYPAVSPRAAHLAYVRRTGSTSTVCIASIDGTGERAIAQSTTAYGIVSVNWSLDGTQLIYVERTDNATRDGSLYRINTNGTGRVLLVADTDYDKYYAAYSPNGGAVCFARNETPWYAFPQNLFVVDADGSNERKVTFHGAGENNKVFCCRFSPDGRKLVYQLGWSSGGNSSIWTVNADGSADTMIVDTTFSNERPTFTRDGAKIIFTRNIGGVWQLATCDPDGSNVQVLPMSSTISRLMPTQAILADASTRDGRVQCLVQPPAAVAAGVQWRLTSGVDTNWYGAGQVSAPLAQAGAPYTLSFRGTGAWVAPIDVTGVMPEPGGTSVVMVLFAPANMALIPTNTFQMGIYQGQGGHTVTLSAFLLDRRPVTVAEYQAFCAATGNPMPPAPAWLWTDTNQPMVNVTWNEAAAFAAWMGKRLPTEAEYECAMRDTLADKLYPWGDTISTADANYANGVGHPTVAGAYRASANYGLYDIAGNVWEWCSDWYTDILNGPVTDPTGPATGVNKVMRGGSWVNSSSKLRCATRYQNEPFVRYADLGFRCAMSVVGTGGPSRGGKARSGISDWWTEWYFGTRVAEFDPARDSDGDGLCDGLEYVAGTDPTNPVSRLSVMGLRAAGDGMWVDWQGGVTATQYLEVGESLAGTGEQWRVIFTNLPPTATVTNFFDVGATNRVLFYRVRAER